MSRRNNPNHIATHESVENGLFVRFTGAIGVVGALFRGGHSGQPLAEAADEFRVAGVPASEIIEGLETSFQEAAAEHDVFTVTRVDEKIL